MGNGKEINSESIREAAAKIDERLQETPKDKELKKAKRAIERDFIQREIQRPLNEVSFNGGYTPLGIT